MEKQYKKKEAPAKVEEAVMVFETKKPRKKSKKTCDCGCDCCGKKSSGEKSSVESKSSMKKASPEKSSQTKPSNAWTSFLLDKQKETGRKYGDLMQDSKIKDEYKKKMKK